MNTLEHFSIAAGCACYRPTGEVSLDEAIELASAAIIYAREHQIERLLLDATGLTGFDPPLLYQRYLIGERFAFDAKGAVKVVLVTTPEMIHPERFGMLVARNRGMRANVFSSEIEAVSWLLGSDEK